jgi:DUF1009 family protein
MTEKKESIGIISGGGQFPLLVADSIRRMGMRVIAVAHVEDTDPSLEEKVDKITWIKLGKLGRLIKVFKQNNVKKVLMAGTISKNHMFSKARPDIRGLSFISRLAIFHDDRILRALADELAKEGIEIVSSTKYLPELLAPEGCLTKRRPSRGDKEDICIGWEVAKEIVALEGIDGTDATISRGGKLAEKGAVVVKICKPNQDTRFDVPSVGLDTLNVMSEVKAAVLAVEAEKTLMFNREEMIRYADKEGISIIAYKEEPEAPRRK